MSKWVIAITGASGVCYGLKLINELILSSIRVDLVISDAGRRVLLEEEGISNNKLKEIVQLWKERGELRLYANSDIGGAIASGSHIFEGMVIVPCSMNTLAAIAHGISSNLIQRTADVVLKEGRRLIVVPRETPLSLIHIENMSIISKAGGIILPAMPSFYSDRNSVDDLINTVVAKILDQMGVENRLVKRWGEERDVSAETACLLTKQHYKQAKKGKFA